MSCDPTENMVNRKVRPFAFIGPVNGMFILVEAGIEKRRFKADAEDIYRLVDSIADKFSDEQEASE